MAEKRKRLPNSPVKRSPAKAAPRKTYDPNPYSRDMTDYERAKFRALADETRRDIEASRQKWGGDSMTGYAMDTARNKASNYSLNPLHSHPSSIQSRDIRKRNLRNDPGMPMMAKGGSVKKKSKKYSHGGSVRGCGIAIRGKTKGKKV